MTSNLESITSTHYERLQPQREHREVLSLWRELKNSTFVAPCESYLHCAESLLSAGAALLAYDVTKAGLSRYPMDTRLRLTMGLALARSQATLEAYEIACRLYDERDDRANESRQIDVEITGLLARVLKDMWLQASTDELRDDCLAQSLNYYEEAYTLGKAHESPNRHWPAINSATLSAVAGQYEKAIRLAIDVISYCEPLSKIRLEPNEERFWLLSTLAEAKLILREIDASAIYYHKASELAHRRRLLGPLCSTARNATILLDALKIQERNRATILNTFRPARAVLFTGHMVDQPGRESPRFPPFLEDKVREAIESKLKECGPVIGFSSAASGSDILFLETVLDRCNGEAYIVLPYDRDAFAQDSVEIAGKGWRERYDRVLCDATEVVTVAPNQRAKWGSVTYEYCNLVLTGLATLAARHLECEVNCLSVWDELPGDGPGGTESLVRFWRDFGYNVDVISPAFMLASDPVTREVSARDRIRFALLRETKMPRHQTPSDQMVIKALMFADVRGFSRISEEEMPGFIEHFYGLLARVIHRSDDRPVITEDRGDGVYCVFDTAANAGRFALELNESIGMVDWVQHVGRNLQIRIGLHAGPVHEFVNPITAQLTYTGTHVARAARIEPIAPPGHVYASREFAAVASLESLTLARSNKSMRFTCAYVGQTEWNKDYGLEPTFHVRRNLSTENKARGV